MWKMCVYVMILFLSFLYLLLLSLGVVLRSIFLRSSCTAATCSKQNFRSLSQRIFSALMALTDILRGAGIPCTLLTSSSSAILCPFRYRVQPSALAHNLAEIAHSCDYIRNFSSPQRPVLSEDEMNVFLHSATLKTLFQGMCPL